MKLQLVAAAITAAVLVIVALSVAGIGPIDLPGNWPGEQWYAEVKVRVARGWWGDPTIQIRDIVYQKGYGFSFGPLIMTAQYRVEVISTRGGVELDRKSVGIDVDWNSDRLVTVTVALGEVKTGATITARLYDHRGGFITETSAKT